MILITGATSGLGLHTSKYLMDRGYGVAGIGRNSQNLNKLSEQYGEQFVPVQADLLDFEGFSDLSVSLPILTGIVFCAGVTRKDPIRFLNQERHLELININVNSPLLLLSSIINNKKLSNGSSIVFIASTSGVNLGVNGLTSYAASKASMIGSVRCLASELSRKKIRVNALAPAGLQTGMMHDKNDRKVATNESISAEKRKYLLFNDFIDPDLVSGPIEFLLSNSSLAITGQTITVCGGSSLGPPW